MKRIILFLAIGLMLSGRQTSAASIVVLRVDPAQRYEKIKPIWDCINLWSPTFTLTPDGQPDTWLRDSQPFINRVILMTATGGRPDYPDVEILKKDAGGNLYYDFSHFDKFLDATKYNGFTPIVVLGAIPFVLAPPNYEIGVFGSITDPPTDYNAWHEFVKTVVSHCVDRYGAQEVLTWSWRLYTEPDNEEWWGGSRREYYKLYDYTVAAIHQSLPGAIVGPGNILGEMEDNWGLKILDHVFNETNYYTGNKGTHLDFFTFSAYERCEKEFPPLKKFQERYQEIMDKLSHYNALDRVVSGIDEGQLLFDEDDNYLWLGDGTEYGASWQAAYQIFGIRNSFDRIVQWGFTSDGVKTPKYNVIEMLEEIKAQTRVGMELIQDTRDDVTRALEKIDGIAAVNEAGTSLSIFVYVHHKHRYPRWQLMDDPQSVKIEINKLPFHVSRVRLKHWLVDSTHSNFFNQWLKDSENINRVAPNGVGGSIYDAAVLFNLDQNGRAFWYSKKSDYLGMDDLETAGPEVTLPVAPDGSVTVTLGMRPHQVSLLVITPDSSATAVECDNLSNGSPDFRLAAYPNPFNGRTTIKYSIAKSARVTISIYDMQGRLVRTLIEKLVSAGSHQVHWNGKDGANREVSSGCYLCKIESNGRRITKKMILIR